ncbi:Cysteine--tRNA ligase [Buchnera aphidicola (Eriosoma grossulariae)]|uniref:cysteine--tRNA ligase n=1 Tax=Buchnera aphidicola TaxID=9 RepID=UPI0034638694
MLKIFNTLTRKKEIFRSIVEKKVSIYVCGVTVYDNCHLGHGRTFLVFDCIIRYLQECGYTVYYVRNITDIDDKIINQSIINKENFSELTNRIISSMHDNFKKLNILPPDIEPRVTHSIEYIINMIIGLINNNHAYIGQNGDVFFSVDSYLDYGILSNQFLTKIKSNTYSSLDSDYKKNKKDFVLWKVYNLSEPFWDSPWGKGRPGWHIECSAIANKFLDSKFDIHGGGIDLLFPHHENERAQSICYNKKSFINYWIHSGMLVLNNLKMSKSLNNIFTLNDLFKKFNGETIRYFCLSTHYRSPLYYNEKNLKHAELCLRKIYFALNNTDNNYISSQKTQTKYELDFHNFMQDDFNTPSALKILLHLAKKINYYKFIDIKLEKVNFFALKLRILGKILGFNLDYKKYFFHNDLKKYDYDFHHIEFLIELRKKYRIQNNWKKADILRKKLVSLGVYVEDTVNGTIWNVIK